MTTLTELLARVEAAERADRELDSAICVALRYPALTHQDGGLGVTMDGSDGALSYYASTGRKIHRGSAPLLTASLDAAVALVEEKLPGHDYLVARISDGAQAEVGPAETFQQIDAKAKTPPLALCAALLRALIAQEPTP